MRHASPIISALAICAMCTNQALAAPDEIEVYTEEMNVPGEFGLEQHLNYTIKGTQTPDYPGQMTTQHVLQVTPEFSYGISNTLEAGLYVPLAFAPDGNAFLNGLRLRLKYIAPWRNDEHLFYGLNVEAGRNSSRTSDSISGMELRPIIGYRDAKWLASFNPILNFGLAAGVSHQPQFEPSLKLTRRITREMGAGLEYYGGYGSLSHLLPANQLSHTLYAVLEVGAASFDFNIGIGHGNANAGGEWVAKGIMELPFK